jgi:hypothetical protein
MLVLVHQSTRRHIPEHRSRDPLSWSDSSMGILVSQRQVYLVRKSIVEVENKVLLRVSRSD